MKIDRIDERQKIIGGKTCGWDQEEHSDFLKLRSKHHSKINSP